MIKQTDSYKTMFVGIKEFTDPFVYNNSFLRLFSTNKNPEATAIIKEALEKAHKEDLSLYMAIASHLDYRKLSDINLIIYIMQMCVSTLEVTSIHAENFLLIIIP